MSKLEVTWTEVYRRLEQAPAGRLYGIPRGGSIVAGLTGRAVDTPDQADWLIDDVIDTGRTAAAVTSRHDKPIWGLYDRQRDRLEDNWIVMPWETKDDHLDRDLRLESLGRELLRTLGYNPADPNLAETPRRWAGWWQEFIDYDPGKLDTVFEVSDTDQIVTVSGINVWSLCEHHLLPFSADISIGYIARERILGLSKFARIAHARAHRLQVQERLVSEIADEITRLTGSPDVAVVARGRHLCLESRGIRTPAVMTSSVMRGAFREKDSARAEFLALLQSPHS